MSSEEAPAEIVLKVKEPKRERVQPLDLLETLVRSTGGMKEKADGEESSPCAAMPAAQDVSQRFKELDITVLHVKLHAAGGNKHLVLVPSPLSEPLAHSGMRMGL
uniref:Uncharacterized protein n=1 Tax=Vitis vinifera TaxID=29760 RepID=A5BMD1_VITVI|nr:hypothetical protein VITISV_043213 [Vitis vinifera]